MEKKYKVAGYVKNALLWKNRNPEEMIRYNRNYFEQQFQDDDEAELVDVYIDVTGNKETYKRPEMVRLLISRNFIQLHSHFSIMLLYYQNGK